MKHLFLIIIKAYQLVLSPLLGRNCRFYPSCSHYSHDAIKGHGAIKGLYLSVRRISRCHPWSEGGYDPVPDTKKDNSSRLS